MHHRLISESNGSRTFVVTLSSGEEVISNLVSLAKELGLGTSSVSGIGAFEHVRLGYFDSDRSSFRENLVDEQVEVLSFTGNIADDEKDDPKFHIHVVLGRRDATTRGGHLIEAIVQPTLELIIVESPIHLQRRHDPDSGLVLLKA